MRRTIPTTIWFTRPLLSSFYFSSSYRSLMTRSTSFPFDRLKEQTAEKEETESDESPTDTSADPTPRDWIEDAGRDNLPRKPPIPEQKLDPSTPIKGFNSDSTVHQAPMEHEPPFFDVPIHASIDSPLTSEPPYGNVKTEIPPVGKIDHPSASGQEIPIRITDQKAEYKPSGSIEESVEEIISIAKDDFKYSVKKAEDLKAAGWKKVEKAEAKAKEMKEGVKQGAENMAGKAREVKEEAKQGAESIASKAREMAGRAEAKAEEVGHKVVETAKETWEKVKEGVSGGKTK